ncbi:MAG TPA: hypothetical protein VIH28_07115 [Ignavibacteriaceae bacterium]
MKTSFKSTGTVLGNLWGGGTGAYPATKLTGKTKDEIIKQATKGLDGSLDSGMGFERLLGAELIIVKTTTTVIEGKVFTCDEIEYEFVGELTDKQKEFLSNCSFL